MRKHPKRAEVDPSRPQGWATSDRNGHVGNLAKMKWQHDWRGNHVMNTRVLVHHDELDTPQRQLGILLIPPDPIPVRHARPENYANEEQPVSTRYTIGPDGFASQVRVVIRPVGQVTLSNRIVTTPGNRAGFGGPSLNLGTVILADTDVQILIDGSDEPLLVE